MRPINNQFSLIRAASKKRFPSLSVLRVSLLSFVILAVGKETCSAADEILNNASVLKLQGLKFGDPVIIATIKTSKCDFDTGMDALEKLKVANVSDAVIQAMLATKSSASPTISTTSIATGDPNDPLTPHSAGV